MIDTMISSLPSLSISSTSICPASQTLSSSMLHVAVGESGKDKFVGSHSNIYNPSCPETPGLVSIKAIISGF